MNVLRNKRIQSIQQILCIIRNRSQFYFQKISVASVNLSTIDLNTIDAVDSGKPLTTERQARDNSQMRGSIGNEPNNGMSARVANASPPPDEKMSVHSLHVGHTNPLIFSTMPRMFKPVFRQNVISLRTSSSDTSCGVVTITTPSQFTSSFGSFIHSATVMCSSDVPGGVSTIK